MHRSFNARRLLVAVASICIALVAWIGFVSLRSVLAGSCTAQSAPCTTGWSYIRNDPYCLVDPTCASPFYRSGWTELPAGQGVDWLGDKTQIYGNGLRMIAVPNYVAFLTIVVAAIAATRHFVRSENRRAVLLGVIICWSIFDATLWMLKINAYDPTLSMANPVEIGMVALVIAVAVFAVRFRANSDAHPS